MKKNLVIFFVLATSLALNALHKDINNLAKFDHIALFNSLVINEDQDLIEEFLNNGLTINAPIFDKDLTLLHMVCGASGDKSSLARFVIGKMADVNARGKSGKRPLHFACSKGNGIIVDLLLRSGGLINQTTDTGETPLHLACQEGHAGIVVRLLQENNLMLDPRDDGDVTPLHDACSGGFFLVVEQLLNKGAAINSRNKEGATPLYLACQKGHGSIISLLLNNGALELPDNVGFTPFYVAISSGHVSVMRIFHQRKPNILLEKILGQTPLFAAAQFGHAATVEYLLLHNVEINEVDAESGSTPLHVACLWGHKEVVKYLLRYGANTSLKANGGATALDCAQVRNHGEIVKLFDQSRCRQCFADAQVLACGGCKKINYCNRECQQKHWPIHKLICKKN